MATTYQFLPWVRRGLTVALDAVDNLGNLPAHANAVVGVKLAGPHAGEAIAPMQMRLHGPGDVIAIDTALVVRTDPRPHATNFEPNYCAIIDFDPPDFPWMLTPARANADHRLRPWLVLVVLEVAKTGKPRQRGQGPLPSVQIERVDVATELPPLAESWSWAHAQVVSKHAAADLPGIQADLQSDPRSNISRLVCPRRLHPNRDYVACVVPAFEPGRLRGLGLAGNGGGPEMNTLAPAWSDQGAGPVLLPVYYHWEFSTGPAGDFEYLARRLRTPKKWQGDPVVGAQLANIGTSPMAVDRLLGGAPTTTMEGALVPLKYKPGAAPDTVHAGTLRAIVNTPASQVDNPVQDDADGNVRRIEVKPPMWGNWHAGQHSVTLAQQPTHWIAGLNLNPRYRGAAGYGAEVVRRFQEDYVDACWDQIGAIRDAEMKFNLTRLAIEALRALKAKHYDPLPPERLVQVMAPALPRIESLTAQGMAYKVNGALGSLGGQIARSSLPGAMLDTAMRRAVSPQRRGLRTAARRTQQLEGLAAMGGNYLQQMAGASTKAAAFEVNKFVPDGILGTQLFDGLALDGAADQRLDLRSRGLRNSVTLGQVSFGLAAVGKAQAGFKRSGVPALKIRKGQSQGVFTDLHVQRFGALVAAAPGVSTADLGRMTAQVEALGHRGVEGFLVEAQLQGSQFQVSAMQLDARSGALRLEAPLVRFGPLRQPVRPKRGDIARLSGVALGTVQLGTARQFDSAALFSNLPPNAFDLQSGNLVGRFALNDAFEFGRIGDAPPQRNVASITLPPALRNRAVLNRFAAATRGVQAQWRDPFQALRVDVQTVDFNLVQAAQTVRLRTQPDVTLAARLASQVSIAQSALGRSNEFVAPYLGVGKAASRLRYMLPQLFDRVMAWPHLREPMYKALAEVDQEAFMPGIGNLPPDLIMLVQVNQYFIDSFMVGANAEMNRELLWRGFPTDLRGTPFQRFWGRVKARADGTLEQLDDMEPIHEWGVQPLGLRADENLKDPNRVALLVKGQLLRRYPNSAVYAWRRVTGVPEDQTKLLKNADGLPPDPALDIQTPVFAGFLKPDITFFGFDIDREKIGEWCFVIEEVMGEPRFGFDVEDPPPGPEGEPRTMGAKPRLALQKALTQYAMAATPAVFASVKAAGYNPYKALSWAHVGVAAGAYAQVNQLANPDAGFASFPKLSDTPTAAEIAHALVQQAFRAYWEGPDLAT